MRLSVDKELVRMSAAIAFAAVMLYLSIAFFSYSLALLERDPPRVVAGIMAGLAGFVFISASITILRDWLIVSRAKRVNQEAGE
ncbi:MAG: hypothetical protein ABWW69_02420 [Pyrodictiaceae archaeon]